MRVLIWAACVAFSAVGMCQTPTNPGSRPMKSTKATATPVIDGDLSDAVWKESQRAEGFVNQINGEKPADQTFAYIAYDAKSIYVAFECFDSLPDEITARETIRDSKYNGDGDPNREDNVTFAIDPNFTMKAEDMSYFSANALGTPSAEIAGGRGNKLEWKGAWTAAAKRTATGYSVEMQIPWEILNYPSSNAPVHMGINFYRYQNRTKTLSLWSDITLHRFFDREGVWQAVTVPQNSFKPKLSVLPYALTSVSEDATKARFGADAKLTVTPNLTAVASIFPDFGTVEGAVESIQFSRNERYVSEKRPFFLEGENYFFPQTRFNDIGAYFYSRRIQSFDVGTKLYGKLNPSDSLGFMNTATVGGRVDTVLRYKHDINANNDVGFFVSNQSMAGDRAAVALVDTHTRKGPYGFETQFAKKWGTSGDGGSVVLSGTYQHGKNTTLLQYHSISNDFDIPNGFIPYRGYKGFMGFTVMTGKWKKGRISDYEYGVFASATDKHSGARDKRGVSFFGDFLTRSDVGYGIDLDYFEQDGTIDGTVSFEATFGASNRFRQYGLGITSGRFQSKPVTFLSPSANFRVFKKLDLGYSGSLLNFQGATQQHILTMGYDISPTQSLGGRMVAQDADTNWYLFYRNSGGSGTNYYLLLGDPNSAKFSKIIQFKVVFAI